MADLSFDDLIPSKGAAPKGLSFDDLVPAPKRKRSVVEDVTGFMANVNRGLGIGDELAATGSTVVNALTRKGPQGFKANMAAQRGHEDSFRAEHPHVAAAALGTGNALTMAAPVGPGAQAFATGGRVVNALRGATVAGLTGAGYAAVDRGSLQERSRAAADAAHDPLTLSLGAVGGGVAGGRPKAKAPTLDNLTIQKDAAYQTVEEDGGAFTGEQFKDLTGQILEDMKAARFNPRLHEKAAAMLDYISDLANQAVSHAPSLSDLDDLRKVIGRDVASSPDDGERRMGVLMKNRIDQFIDDAALAGTPELQRARNLNTRVEKLRSLDLMDDKAARRAARTAAGGNKENALRQNVDRFIDDTGNLTPAEDAAARKVVMGTQTGNVLRQVGKLSPEGNGLNLTVHTVGAIGSHGASLPAAAVGFIAKKASEAITKGNVQALRELIASGGTAAQEVSRQLADPQYAELRAQVANDLAVQAGVQGTAREQAAYGVR